MRARSTLFCQPPTAVIATFVVGGGAEPRTPRISTRSSPEVGELGGVEVGDDVDVEVRRVADLVEQLRLHGVRGDGAAGPGVLGDHRRAVGGDLGDREAGVGEVGDGAEPGEVAAGGLGAALDDVAGAHGPGERVVVVGSPAPPPGGRTDDQRSVGDATGHHDVGTVGQGAGDAEAAEVGVGGERPMGPGRQRLAGREVRQRVARFLQLAETVGDVVAVDVRDAQVVPAAGGQLAGGGGEPGGVQPAGVGDDADPVRHQVVERGVELVEERDRVALGGVLGARLAEDQHGDLGEVVAGEDVDAAGGSHVGHGRGAVAVEAGAVADADRAPPLVACRRHAVLATCAVPSKPISPAGFASMSSSVTSSPSTATTRAV